jgi:hypothetical protein
VTAITQAMLEAELNCSGSAHGRVLAPPTL